jgi:xanthine dehydrogenase large subunit
VRQIVAQEMGVKYEQVLMAPTSTDKNINTSPTAASAGTDLNGNAALDACRRIRKRIAQVAAAMLEKKEDGLAADPSSLLFENGEVVDTRQPKRRLIFEEVVRRAYELRVDLGERGFYATPGVDFNRDTGRGTPFLYFTNGVACSEVRIDRFTGEVTVTRTDLIMDAGRMINPGIDRGQVVGGFVQGMGWVTTEQLYYDEKGRLISCSPTTYKIPAVTDLPEVFNVRFLENDANRVSLHRSKAVGEPPLLLGVSVWLAVKNALSYAGSPKLSLPATGERVLLALSEAQARPAVSVTG